MSAQNQTTKTKIKSADVRRILATSSEGLPLIGYGLFWNFREQLKMPLADFHAILKRVGMVEKIAPKTRKKAAVGKAVDAFLADSDERKRRFRRKAIDDEKVAIYVIVTESVDTVAKNAEYSTMTTVTYHKDTEAVLVEGTDEEKERIHSLVSFYEDTYTSDQIRASVLKFLFDHAGGVTVRENGGLYFVPANKQNEFKMLKDLFDELQKISKETSLGLIQIPDSAETAQTMWKALVVEAEQEISANMKEIEDLKKDPSSKAMDRRFKNLTELRLKIEMYSVLLRGTADDLVNKVSKAEKAFMDKVAALKTETKK